MTKRIRKYQELLRLCRGVSTSWLKACHSLPGERQSALSRLAVRATLQERGAL